MFNISRVKVYYKSWKFKGLITTFYIIIIIYYDMIIL